MEKAGLSDSGIDRKFQKMVEYVKGCPMEDIRLSPSENREDNVVELGFNGTMFLLERGKRMQVPAPVAEILRHADLI